MLGEERPETRHLGRDARERWLWGNDPFPIADISDGDPPMIPLHFAIVCRDATPCDPLYPRDYLEHVATSKNLRVKLSDFRLGSRTSSSPKVPKGGNVVLIVPSRSI